MKTKIAFIYFFSFILFISSNFSAGEAHANDYINQAQDKILAKQYDQAIKILQDNRTSAVRDKKSAIVDNLIGWSYFTTGRTKDAEEYLNSALINADHENNQEIKKIASNNIGVVYFVEGDLDKALNSFSQPYNKNTKIASDYRGLIRKKRIEAEIEKNTQVGLTHRANLEFEEAVMSYGKALNLAPKDPRLLELKGYSLFRLGKFDESTRVLEDALRTDSAQSRLNIGLNLIKDYCAEDKEEQIALLLQRTKLPPSTIKLWWKNDYEFKSTCSKSTLVKANITR